MLAGITMVCAGSSCAINASRGGLWRKESCVLTAFLSSSIHPGGSQSCRFCCLGAKSEYALPLAHLTRSLLLYKGSRKALENMNQHHLGPSCNKQLYELAFLLLLVPCACVYNIVTIRHVTQTGKCSCK